MIVINDNNYIYFLYTFMEVGWLEDYSAVSSPYDENIKVAISAI